MFQVLQHVRLPLMSPKFLVGTVGSDLLVKSDDSCRDLLDEAKNYLLLPQERPLMQGPRTRPRKPIRCGEVLFAGMLSAYQGICMLSIVRCQQSSLKMRMLNVASTENTCQCVDAGRHPQKVSNYDSCTITNVSIVNRVQVHINPCDTLQSSVW